jgi:hypothetical protein
MTIYEAICVSCVVGARKQRGSREKPVPRCSRRASNFHRCQSQIARGPIVVLDNAPEKAHHETACAKCSRCHFRRREANGSPNWKIAKMWTNSSITQSSSTVFNAAGQVQESIDAQKHQSWNFCNACGLPIETLQQSGAFAFPKYLSVNGDIEVQQLFPSMRGQGLY